MSKLLPHVYYGHIRPFEREYPDNPKIIPWRQRYDEAFARVKNELSEEGRKHLDKLLTAQTNLHIIHDDETFSDGFCLGALLMIEVFADKDKIIRDAEKSIETPRRTQE